jgi:hypothetical protein
MELLKRAMAPGINEVRMKMFILLFSLGIGVSQTAEAYISKARIAKEREACRTKAMLTGITQSFSCGDSKCKCDPAVSAVPGGEIFPGSKIKGTL